MRRPNEPRVKGRQAKSQKSVPERLKELTLVSHPAAALTISIAAIAVWLGSASSAAEAIVDHGGDVSLDEIGDEGCMLYMAESSVPNSGYGIFTVRSFEKNEYILKHDGPNIAVTDIREDDYEMEIFDNVWWGPNGGMCDHMLYEASSTYDFQIMFGALPNYHPHLWNLDFDQPASPFDDSVADRTTDPGAGAFSYYTGKHFKASRRIEAGHEIFLDYGDHWLKSRGDAYEHIPRKVDYKQAGKILSMFPDLLSGLAIGVELSQALESTLQTIRTTLSSLDKLSRVKSLIPDNLEDLKRLASAATEFSQTALSDAIALEFTVERRDVNWIRQHGMCLDNIFPAKSRIAHAGHGAFARRALHAGEMVVPVPLLHAPDRDMLKTRTITERKDDEGNLVLARHKTARDGWQLLLNYCWGHSDSSLVLCPVTNSILINHCSLRTKQCGEQGPNAAYRWASGWDPNTEGSLKKTVDELAESKGDRVLSIEIVALRDIEEDEEITMDYGEEWEEAWEQHVRDWKPPRKESPLASNFSIAQMNEDEGEILLIGELRAEEPPRQDGYFTACWYHENDEENDGDEDESDWKLLSDEDILARYAIDGSQFAHNGEFGGFWPCSVISVDRDDEKLSYTVRILRSDFHDEPAWADEEKPCLLFNYPRASIKYVTMPYRSDQHLQSAFRHHIEIRPDIFPEQWKNRPRKTSDLESILK